MIRIKQNDGSNNLFRNFNSFRNAEFKYGSKKFSTEKNIKMITEVKEEEVKSLNNIMRHPNLKKIFIYLKYRMTKAKNRQNIVFKTDEFLNLKGQDRQTNSIKAIINSLDILSKIKLENYSAVVIKNGIEIQVSDSNFLFRINEDKSEISNNKIVVIGGKWTKTLINYDQFAYLPEEIFSFNKLELEIAYNIILRCRLQFYKDIIKKEKKSFALRIKNVLKGVSLPNKRKYGASEVVRRIDNVLKKLQNKNLFFYEYRNKKIDELPKRNILDSFKSFMVDFYIGGTRLGDTYINENYKDAS